MAKTKILTSSKLAVTIMVTALATPFLVKQNRGFSAEYSFSYIPPAQSINIS